MNTIKLRNLAPANLRSNNFFFDDAIFNNLFNDVWKSGSIMPASNIKESTDSFTIEMAVPGFAKEDFKIKLEKDVLTIYSEKKEENNQDSDNYTRREFRFSEFKRSWTLPETVDVEAISASYTNGILNVLLPKKQVAVVAPNKMIDVK